MLLQSGIYWRCVLLLFFFLGGTARGEDHGGGSDAVPTPRATAPEPSASPEPGTEAEAERRRTMDSLRAVLKSLENNGKDLDAGAISALKDVFKQLTSSLKNPALVAELKKEFEDVFSKLVGAVNGDQLEKNLREVLTKELADFREAFAKKKENFEWLDPFLNPRDGEAPGRRKTAEVPPASATGEGKSLVGGAKKGDGGTPDPSAPGVNGKTAPPTGPSGGANPNSAKGGEGAHTPESPKMPTPPISPKTVEPTPTERPPLGAQPKVEPKLDSVQAPRPTSPPVPSKISSEEPKVAQKARSPKSEDPPALPAPGSANQPLTPRATAAPEPLPPSNVSATTVSPPSIPAPPLVSQNPLPPISTGGSRAPSFDPPLSTSPLIVPPPDSIPKITRPLAPSVDVPVPSPKAVVSTESKAKSAERTSTFAGIFQPPRMPESVRPEVKEQEKQRQPSEVPLLPMRRELASVEAAPRTVRPLTTIPSPVPVEEESKEKGTPLRTSRPALDEDIAAIGKKYQREYNLVSLPSPRTEGSEALEKEPPADPPGDSRRERVTNETSRTTVVKEGATLSPSSRQLTPAPTRPRVSEFRVFLEEAAAAAQRNPSYLPPYTDRFRPSYGPKSSARPHSPSYLF